MNSQELFEFLKNRLSINIETKEVGYTWPHTEIKVTLLLRNPATEKDVEVSSSETNIYTS